MSEIAFAMGGGAQPAAGGVDLSFIIMMVVLFAIMYFLIIRPQQQKQKAMREMISNLAHGDIVMTTGGLQGKITALTDTVVTLEIADKVRVKVGRNYIAAVVQKAGKDKDKE